MGVKEIILIVVCAAVVISVAAAAIVRKVKGKSSCGGYCDGCCEHCKACLHAAKPQQSTKVSESDNSSERQ